QRLRQVLDCGSSGRRDAGKNMWPQEGVEKQHVLRSASDMPFQQPSHRFALIDKKSHKSFQFHHRHHFLKDAEGRFGVLERYGAKRKRLHEVETTPCGEGGLLDLSQKRKRCLALLACDEKAG